ncbi:MAG TPA: type II toxin-antitoxin system RelE/ParE family toxin [Terracidiphilus sp.]|nr:type II toxin-antitoxin system RelE/ParE family toxin [Terracidiphilus sp.]
MIAFELHPEAAEDIDGIAACFQHSSPGTASRLVGEFFSAFELLAQFPHHGFFRPELTGRPLRFKLVREYLIAYAPNKKPLWIVAVVDGRRNPRVIAAILRGRE